MLLFITTLIHYTVTYHKGFTFADVLVSPSSYEGMNLSVTGPYGGLGGSGSFYLIYNQKLVRIDYQNYERGHDRIYVPPRWGEVSLYGQVQADGSLRAWRVHNYDYNYLLYVLSFFTGIGVLIFFFHEWKITRRGIVKVRVIRAGVVGAGGAGVPEVVKHA
ncbi:MAG: hypothetical protein AABX13_03820 [Nanoarchaeota archaeon]